MEHKIRCICISSQVDKNRAYIKPVFAGSNLNAVEFALFVARVSAKSAKA